MVRISEFRIPMPMTVEEYQIAQTYMKSTMQRENTTSKEGVQILQCEMYKDESLGGAGKFTHVMYHLQSKAPKFIRAIAPANALNLEEENWNAFPRTKTVLKCPYFSKFKITIESIHLPNDRGTSENVFDLPPEKLKIRRTECLDIASTSRDMWSRMIAKSNIDPSKLRSSKLNRGPLTKGWQSSCSPVMCAYKLVTVEAPYLMFGKQMESTVVAGERALFLEGHRKMFGWMDDWAGLTIEDVQRIERENQESLRSTFNSSRVVPEDVDQPNSSTHDEGEVGEEEGDGEEEKAETPKEVQAASSSASKA